MSSSCDDHSSDRSISSGVGLVADTVEEQELEEISTWLYRLVYSDRGHDRTVSYYINLARIAFSRPFSNPSWTIWFQEEFEQYKKLFEKETEAWSSPAEAPDIDEISRWVTQELSQDPRLSLDDMLDRACWQFDGQTFNSDEWDDWFQHKIETSLTENPVQGS